MTSSNINQVGKHRRKDLLLENRFLFFLCDGQSHSTTRHRRNSGKKESLLYSPVLESGGTARPNPMKAPWESAREVRRQKTGTGGSSETTTLTVVSEGKASRAG